MIDITKFEGHTVGPWKFSDTSGEAWNISDLRGKSLMNDAQYYPSVPIDKADWTLIAAAPDLLAEVIRLRAELAGTSTQAQQVSDMNPMLHNTLLVLTPEEVSAVNRLRARKEWMARDMARCKCDHNGYCQHCYPESFRPGGVWHGLGA